MFIYFNTSNRGHGTSPHSLITHLASEQCHLLIIVGGAIFQIYNVQNLKITRITTFRICNVLYQAGSRWDPKWVFNFLRFFEWILYKSNYIIFILRWCGTHTEIRSKLVDIVRAGSQKITIWGPQRTPTPLGILRVKARTVLSTDQFIYKVTPCITVGPEKLTGPQPVKKFPEMNQVQRFITSFTTSRQLSLCWARLIQSMPPTHFKIHFNILPLYFWVFQVTSFSQVSPLKPCIQLSSHPYVLHAHPILFYL